MNILVVNVGSSTIKYQLFDMETESVVCKGLLDKVGIRGSTLEHKHPGKDTIRIDKDIDDHKTGMDLILKVLLGDGTEEVHVDAVGHRVVHGGESFSSSVVIDESVIKVIEDCSSLAPLHNPPNLMGIRSCMGLLPGIPHVAVFDTAFHQTMKPENYLYALPREAYEKYKVRRYGFHGTSHEFVSQEAAKILGKPYGECRMITLHLGSGASMAAIRNGLVVDTSMGFTPLEGLVMGTRTGDMDPAIVCYLMDKLGLSPGEMDSYLNKKSGLLGLSGVSADLRYVIEAADSGDIHAKEALEVYCLRIKGYVGNYMAKLNGCDCLVFTAGVGENSSLVRERVLENMDALGIGLDREKNRAGCMNCDISLPGTPVRIYVVPTNEELMIARETLELVR
ncbi:acetate/propionate family kinase [Youngiibacter fragilis]|uniref:Acetate kinase n=1 Tax=Youngiibacter fragilis 232.1 TaxID=994573 RepID=V7I3D6_9CLOT|nr:acetate kinase [Youngiibacter fragilis]ETA79694.1 acetate kinase [Youngiibacter fragilis 232.1]